MAGIKDVAREANVSLSTVSYVLSGKRPVSAKTTDRVMKTIEDLGYIPDASAQKLRGGLKHIIAIAPGRREVRRARFSTYFMNTALQAKAAGYDVLLLTGEDAVADIERVTRSNLADGVVLLDIEEDDARTAAAAHYGKPCVAIGYPANRSDCACVDIDFSAMGVCAAHKLAQARLGRAVLLRSVEDVDEPMPGYLDLFRNAFVESACELGLEVVEPKVVNYKDFDADSFVTQYLCGFDKPTAIVNEADASLLNVVLGVMKAKGLAVPQDVSVLSCGTLIGDVPMGYGISEMPITPPELCERAISILLDAIERHRDIRGVEELRQATFVDRGSLVQGEGSQ